MKILPENRISPEQWAKAREMAQQTHKSLTVEAISTLVWAEFLYWYDADIEHPASVFALGPLANLTAYLCIGESSLQREDDRQTTTEEKLDAVSGLT